MDYSKLFSSRLPVEVSMPPGFNAQIKYVFSVTYADPDTLAAHELCDALSRAISHEGRDLAMYPPPQGHVGLRQMIVEDLKRKREIPTSIDSVFLSAGANGAIQCITDAFIDPGDIVLVEEFSYLGTLNMLLSRRAEVVHIPTDADGMDTDALEEKIRELERFGRHPKMIYTISVYQNPTGVTLSLERRKRMLEIARKYQVPILENESYADFRIDGPPLPPAIMGMDDSDMVMYVSAFTKLLGCGLRLGFGVVPEPVRKGLARLRFGGAPSHMASMAVHEYMRQNGDRHIQAIAASLRAKRDAMIEALVEHFPPTCWFTRPHGGMMVWVRLPEKADTWSALGKAVERGVKYNPGPVFRAYRDCHNYLRLTYSHNTPDEIREGVALLSDVFRKEGLFG